MKKTITAIVILVLVGGVFWYMRLPDRVFAKGGVPTGIVDAASPDGVVKHVYVAVGDMVTKGQPLFAMDTTADERHLAVEQAKLAELAASLPRNVLVPSPLGNGAKEEKPLADLVRDEENARRTLENESQKLAAANITFARYDDGDPRNKDRTIARIKRDEAAIGVKKAKDAFAAASYARAQREALEKTHVTADAAVSAAIAARIAEYQAQLSAMRLAEQAIAAAVVTAPESGRVLSVAAIQGQKIANPGTSVRISHIAGGGIGYLALFDKEYAAIVKKDRECHVAFSSGATYKGHIRDIVSIGEDAASIGAEIVIESNAEEFAVPVGDIESIYILTGKEYFIPWLSRRG